MADHTPALTLIKDLRGVLDDRLSANEDYRALRALDKMILEIKVAADVSRDEQSQSYSVSTHARNAVAEAQQNLSARFGS